MTDSKYIPVRLSHLFYHSAVGAVVRTDDDLLAIMDIRHWTDGQGRRAGELIPYVDQVKSALFIDEDLVRPPVAKTLSTGRVEGVSIPAVRFPRWTRCPGCGLLSYSPWQLVTGGARPRCRICRPGPLLEQVPFVLVHDAGYLADVDWHFLAHRHSRSAESCPRDNQPGYLKIEAVPGSSAQAVVCTRCRARTTFRPGMPLPWGQTWQQPWIFEPPDLEPDADGVILAVNDVRIHDTFNAMAIVIPPESRIQRGTPLDKLYCNSQKRSAIDRAVHDVARKAAIKSVAGELGCSTREIEKALEEIRNGFPLYGRTFTPGVLLESEFQALCDPIEDVKEDEDFVTVHHTAGWRRLGGDPKVTGRLHRLTGVIDRLVAVDRLRAVMVLKGFNRRGGELVPPDIEGKSRWLPAVELFGEGIFFTLSEPVLQKWEKQPQVAARAEDFKKRKIYSGLKFEPDIDVSPRFLLLHTLAHITIRQLEALAGYPAASLKERIYCQAGENPMAGILVFVAVPDKYGSLGGLSELARPETFLKLMKIVFDHADWCSLDPVCSEHEGQGPNQLNRAACHCCALIPEPACSYKNILLDRTFISRQTTGNQAAFPGFLDSAEDG